MKSLHRNILIASATFLVASFAFSQSTWTGATNESWATSTNWSETPPSAGVSQSISYGTGGVANATQTLDGSYLLESITNESTSAVVINNGTGINTLTFAGASGGAILNASNANLTIGAGTSIAMINPTASYGIMASSGKQLSIGSSIDLTAGLTVAGYGNIQLSGIISSIGSITVYTGGTATLTGANTYSGGTTVGIGVLKVGTGGTLGTGSVTIADSGILEFTGSDSKTVANVISSSGPSYHMRVGIVHSGTATTTLTGANTYYGAITISSGTLAVGTGGTLGVVNPSIYSYGAVTNNATLAFTGSDSKTVYNAISGTGTLVQSGTGTTTLAGANSYSGGTTISAGTLVISGGTLGSGAITNNATLAFTGSSSNTVANAISGTGGLVCSGNGSTTLTGENSYSGGTIINNFAILVLGNAAALGNASNSLTINGGMLYLGGFNVAVGTATLSGGSIQNGSLAASTVLLNGGSISASLTGAGGVFQQSGTTTLFGSNSYSGGTSISGGTLEIFIGGALGTGSVTINNGGTLAISGSTTVSNAISGTGTLVVQAGTGTATLTGANSYSGGTIISSGTLALADTGSLGAAGVVNDAALSLATSGSKTISNGITGSGKLIHSGSGMTTLTGANSYTGGTVIEHGTLIVGTGGSLGSGGVIFGDSGATDPNVAIEFRGSDSKTVFGDIIGSGSLRGHIIQSGTGTTMLAGRNISANVVISDGKLVAGSASTFTFPNPTLTITGGELDLGGFNSTFSSVRLSGGVIKNGTLSVGGGAFLNGGLISASIGASGVIQQESGTTTLSGVNSYYGQVAVIGGTLALVSAGSLNANFGGLTVSGGSLDLGGGNCHWVIDYFRR